MRQEGEEPRVWPDSEVVGEQSRPLFRSLEAWM